MTCVVLLGFSTTGKSTILQSLQKVHGGAIETVDSDQRISADFDGHIYNIFLRCRNGADTTPAIRLIEQGERRFLGEVNPGKKPLLMAAGLFLPTREPEWRQFLERVHPVCFYLQKEPEDVLQGLRQRRIHHSENPELAHNSGFGCWDQDVTTEYRDGKWAPIEDDNRALENVRRHMGGVANIYERCSVSNHTFTWSERKTSDGQERLDAAIRQRLGL